MTERTVTHLHSPKNLFLVVLKIVGSRDDTSANESTDMNIYLLMCYNYPGVITLFQFSQLLVRIVFQCISLGLKGHSTNFTQYVQFNRHEEYYSTVVLIRNKNKLIKNNPDDVIYLSLRPQMFNRKPVL